MKPLQKPPAENRPRIAVLDNYRSPLLKVSATRAPFAAGAAITRNGMRG